MFGQGDLRIRSDGLELRRCASSAAASRDAGRVHRRFASARRISDLARRRVAGRRSLERDPIRAPPDRPRRSSCCPRTRRASLRPDGNVVLAGNHQHREGASRSAIASLSSCQASFLESCLSFASKTIVASGARGSAELDHGVALLAPRPRALSPTCGRRPRAPRRSARARRGRAPRSSRPLRVPASSASASALLARSLLEQPSKLFTPAPRLRLRARASLRALAHPGHLLRALLGLADRRPSA